MALLESSGRSQVQIAAELGIQRKWCVGDIWRLVSHS